MIVAFCGHSSYISNIEDEKIIIDFLIKSVNDEPCDFFLGEYGNFDKFAYACAKKYKSTHHNSKLIFITPYYSTNYQNTHLNSKKEYFDSIIFPDLETVPPRYAIKRRNKWIVDNANIVIAYITHDYGGAYEMFNYAKKKNKIVYNIAEISKKGQL